MDMILKNTFQSISPAYELIGDVTVGTNTTTVQFTGLNITKDDEIMLVINKIVPNTLNTDADVRLFVNNNTTTTNYYYQQLVAGGSSVSGERANSTRIARGNLGSHLSICKMKLANSGYFISQEQKSSPLSSSITLTDTSISTTFTAISVTQITLTAAETNGIGAGSRFQLYKLVAEKVADIIVPSNTTSVDITGLDIGKGGEYMLTTDILTTAVNPDFMICINENYTLTDYYSQMLRADGTTVDATKTNNPRFGFEQSPERFFGSVNIKLSNNEYFVFQSNTITHYGSSSLFLTKYSGASMFTMADITSLRILSSLSNGIGANSRFTLYKMK